MANLDRHKEYREGLVHFSTYVVKPVLYSSYDCESCLFQCEYGILVIFSARNHFFFSATKPFPMLQRKQVIRGHEGICWSAKWAPSGDLLATCGQDKRIKIWKLSTKGLECVSILNENDSIHTRTIRRVSWRGDSAALAACSFDSTCSLWSVDADGSGRHLATLSGQESEVKGISFSPCGEYLSTCSRDKSVWIFDVATALSVNSQKSENSLDKEFQQVCLDDGVSDNSEDHEFMFASSPRVRSAAASDIGGLVECVAVLTGHSQDVKNVVFDPLDPFFLVSVSYDDSVKIWGYDGDDWELRETLRGNSGTVWDISFNNEEGHEFATVSADGTLRFWSAKLTSPKQYNVGQWYRNQGPLMLTEKIAQRQWALPVAGTDSWSCQTVHVTVARADNMSASPLYSLDWQGDLIAVACGDNAVRVFRRTVTGSVTPVATMKTSSEPNCVSWRSTQNGQVPMLVAALDDGNIEICELIE